MIRRLLGFVFLSLLVSGIGHAGDTPGRLGVLGRSMLIPGLGHLSLGYKGRAQAHMAADLVTWGAFTVFQVQGRIREDSYIEMAELFAGVEDASGRSNDYYRRVGRYPNAEYYNDEIRRDARARHGDDLEARAEYYDRNRVPDDQEWSWVSNEERQRYRAKRSASNGAFQRAGYTIGIAVANRLFSAVDAMRLMHKKENDTAWHLSLRPDPGDPTATPFLCVSVRFR